VPVALAVPLDAAVGFPVVDDAGQYVVVSIIISVVTDPSFAGQFVTVAAHDVMG
jgi:hypothetical protein